MEPVDNRVSVETPEGVEFELELAGVAPRAGAYAVDLTIRMALVWATLLVVIPLGDRVGAAVALINLFVVIWLYAPLFELFRSGQTPGKMLFKIRVVHRDGTPVGWYGVIVRNLIRTVDMLPFGYVTAVVAMVVSGRFQRLGDLAADTLVVYDRGAYATAEMADLPPAEPVQIPLVLSPLEQATIVDYAERSQMLGPARSAELASILEPLGEGEGDTSMTRYLYGLAQRIVRWG